MTRTTKDSKRQQEILAKFTAYKSGTSKLAFGDEGDPLKPKFVEFAKNIAATTFPQYLRKLISAKGLQDKEVYERACINKDLFYRILKADNTYHTAKDKVAALTIALRLSIAEAEDLYLSAGYNLTKSELPDLVIRFCIENNIYRIDDVNYCLIYYGYKPLGSGVQERKI